VNAQYCYQESLNIFTIHVENQTVYDSIEAGINELTIFNPRHLRNGWELSWFWVVRAKVFIEYEYLA
jgi:hypothetical protein